jgi:hypothetical protein
MEQMDADYNLQSALTIARPERSRFDLSAATPVANSGGIGSVANTEISFGICSKIPLSSLPLSA